VSHFNGKSLVKKWHVADPKMIFTKRSGACLIRAKGQTHPGSTEIGKSLHKIQKIALKVCAIKQELICVSQMAYYLCEVLCLAFRWPFR
jgi:hypothetical protein